MRAVVAAVEGEYRRYKKLAEDAIAQIDDKELVQFWGESNSIATIMVHVGGNLSSRFTDFLTTDGEKPWRDRDSEFLAQSSRAEVMAVWQKGWSALFTATESLTDADLAKTVTIRKLGLTVIEALARSLSHVSSHVGQIVYIAKGQKGSSWKTLSIPKGKSAEFNANPDEKKSRPPAKA